MSAISQRGSGALIMVMIMLMMGTLMLHGTRRQLNDSMALVGEEQRYWQQFTAAVSALAWGERQRWPAGERWQCRQQADYPWRACLHASLLLLRADSGPGTLALWRWVNTADGEMLQAQPHGWLDYCPLMQEGDCDVD